MMHEGDRGTQDGDKSYLTSHHHHHEPSALLGGNLFSLFQHQNDLDLTEQL